MALRNVGCFRSYISSSTDRTCIYRSHQNQPLLNYFIYVCLSVLQPSDSTETPNFVSQRRQEDERIKNLQNPEVVYEQLNLSDSNENSLSDKSRRAKCVKERNRMNNSPAEDL